MKMNKDDISVYVTLTLLGAGLGLLIGTYIGSALEARREKHNEPLEELDEETEETGDGPQMQKKARVRKQNRVSPDVEKEEALERLTEEYEVGPTNVQRQLILNGLMSIAELEDILKTMPENSKSGKDEKHLDYTAYTDKPDLEDLVVDVVEPRFELLSGRSYKNKIVVNYYQDDGVVTREAGNGSELPFEHLNEILDDGTLDEWLNEAKGKSIYVNDKDRGKRYQITLRQNLVEEPEEPKKPRKKDDESE